MNPFEFPKEPHVRRHGPRGYSAAKFFRPWLRDEFSFRCVYCLTRERWGKGQSGFHVEHLRPQSKHPNLRLQYDNLVYACHRCNLAKRAVDSGIPDPCELAYGECLEIQSDGRVKALNEQGNRMIQLLGLNDPENMVQRCLILNILRLSQSDPAAVELFKRFFAFPEDLPDLERCEPPPPDNSRPQGIRQSHFARRQRGELPETY